MTKHGSITNAYITIACILHSLLQSAQSFTQLPAAESWRQRSRLLHYGAVTPAFLTICSTTAESATNEATLRSIIFHNIPETQNPDLFCDLLMELGACSTSITDANVGTDDEIPLFGEPSDTYNPWRQSTDPSEPWAPVPLWTQCTVTAQFTDSVDLAQVLQQVKETTLFRDVDEHDDADAASKWLENPEVTVLPNQDWVIKVQQSWKPIIVADRIVLRFPWHTRQDISQLVGPDIDTSNLVELELQGGIAFGTGEHATTQLCLEWLDQAVRNKLLASKSTVRVLDYEAGSAVLGMAACAMARDRVQAIGIEIDYDSCRIANANAATNEVNMATYLPPLTDTTDSESKSLLLKAHAHARRRLQEQGLEEDNSIVFLPDWINDQQYDITVANILAGPLMTLAPTLARMTSAGGRLGLSGILPHQGEEVAKAYRAVGFENVGVEKEYNGWVLVTGTKAS